MGTVLIGSIFLGSSTGDSLTLSSGVCSVRAYRTAVKSTFTHALARFVSTTTLSI